MSGSVQLQCLSKGQRQEIFQAACRVMDETGIAVGSAEAHDVLNQAGAGVRENRVYIPPPSSNRP